jgi:hypothetical protein
VGHETSPDERGGEEADAENVAQPKVAATDQNRRSFPSQLRPTICRTPLKRANDKPRAGTHYECEFRSHKGAQGAQSSVLLSEDCRRSGERQARPLRKSTRAHRGLRRH